VAIRDRESLKVPEISITVSAEAHPATALGRGQIKSFCDHARKANKDGRVLALELRSKVLELRDTDDRNSHQRYSASTTLADFLRDVAQDPDARLYPMQQSRLALSIACSVLQLRQTTWYSTPWNSSSIVFPTRRAGGLDVAGCAPYVEQVVDAKLAQTTRYPAALDTEAAKKTMLELAVLLLEIMHNQPIEAWAEKYDLGATGTYWDRMRVATHWMERSHDKLLFRHLQPIEHCLQRCAQSKLDWDADFRKMYCENVIKPLHEVTMQES
jgi:hypothetical protein